MAIIVPGQDDEEEQGKLRSEYANAFKSEPVVPSQQLAPKTEAPAIAPVAEPTPAPAQEQPSSVPQLRDEYKTMFETQKQLDSAVKQKAAASNADEKGKAS